MNLPIRVTLSFLFLLCIYDLSAQKNFRPGYVITNDNDTLRGFIDYRGDTRNARICDFKESETSVIKEFQPFSIKGFRFNDGKFYVSKNIKSDGGEIQLFLEYLVNGIAHLYYYAEGSNFHYFIEKSDGQLFELTNTQNRAFIDGKLYVYDTKNYIGLLRYAFADCQQMFPLINDATLDDKSLIEITKKYHDYICGDGKCIIYEKQSPVTKVTFAPFISVNYSFLKFNNNYNYQTIHSGIANIPSIGLQMNTSLHKVNEKLSFLSSIEFGQISYHNTGISPVNASPEVINIDIASLKGKVGIKYTYPKGKIRPTLTISGNVLWPVFKDGKIVDDLQGNSSIYAGEFEDYMIAKFMLGYGFDLGVDYHYSASIVPFFSLGYDDSRGSTHIDAVNLYFASNRFTTVIRTFHISAGIYF